MQLWVCCFADSVSIQYVTYKIVRQCINKRHLQCRLLKPKHGKRAINLDHQLGVSMEDVLTGLLNLLEFLLV